MKNFFNYIYIFCLACFLFFILFEFVIFILIICLNVIYYFFGVVCYFCFKEFLFFLCYLINYINIEFIYNYLFFDYDHGSNICFLIGENGCTYVESKNLDLPCNPIEYLYSVKLLNLNDINWLAAVSPEGQMQLFSNFKHIVNSLEENEAESLFIPIKACNLTAAKGGYFFRDNGSIGFYEYSGYFLNKRTIVEQDIPIFVICKGKGAPFEVIFFIQNSDLSISSVISNFTMPSNRPNVYGYTNGFNPCVLDEFVHNNFYIVFYDENFEIGGIVSKVKKIGIEDTFNLFVHIIGPSEHFDVERYRFVGAFYTDIEKGIECFFSEPFLKSFNR